MNRINHAEFNNFTLTEMTQMAHTAWTAAAFASKDIVDGMSDLVSKTKCQYSNNTLLPLSSECTCTCQLLNISDIHVPTRPTKIKDLHVFYLINFQGTPPQFLKCLGIWVNHFLFSFLHTCNGTFFFILCLPRP